MDDRPAKAREPVTPSKPEQPRSGQTAVEWDVLVRHSPFLLKHAKILAPTAEEAKQQFLGLVKAKHEERAGKEKADERGRLAAERIRLVLRDGLSRVHELDWEIRPAAEVEATERRYRERVDQVWSNVREPQLA